MIAKHSLRIGQLVGVGLGFILFVALLIGLAGRVAYDINEQQNEAIQLRGEVNRLTLNLRLLSLEQADTVRQYLEKGDRRLQQQYQTQRDEFLVQYELLTKLVRTVEEEAALRRVMIAERQLHLLTEDVIALYGRGEERGAQVFWSTVGVRQQRIFVEATELWSELQGGNSEQIVEEARETETLAVQTVTMFSVFILVGAVVISLIITRSISRPISQLAKATAEMDFDLTTRVTPSGPAEIAVLGETFNSMAARLQHSMQALQHHKDELEDELNAASQTQASFLPPRFIKRPRLEIACFWQPARQLGGDFYTHFDLGNGRLGIALGDVIGKGATAAMTSSLTMGLLEAQAPTHDTAKQLLTTLNQQLYERFQADSVNVACCYLLLDEETQQVQFTNAGCMFPYLYRAGEWDEIQVIGLPLGVMEDIDYLNEMLTLHSGERLLLMSDGLVEAQNEAGEMFGFSRWEQSLTELSDELSTEAMVEHLVAQVQQFTAGAELHDDMTLILLRML